VNTVPIERPQQALGDGEDRAAKAKVDAGLSRDIGDCRQFRARLLFLLCEVRQQKAGEEQIRDAQDRLVQLNVKGREPCLTPRAHGGHGRLDQEHADGNAGGHDRSDESPPVGGREHDEQEEQEERTDGAFADECQRGRPEHIEAMQNMAMCGLELRRPMHVDEDGQAVHGVGRQHGISDSRQPRGLGRIQIDGRERRDREKCAADGKHSLEPSDTSRVDLLSRDHSGDRTQ
jgi:hypothetical protein